MADRRASARAARAPAMAVKAHARRSTFRRRRAMGHAMEPGVPDELNNPIREEGSL